MTAGALGAAGLLGCRTPAVPRAAAPAAAAMDRAAFHAARRYAATAFGDIAYFERGQGEAALFLHGFPLNGFQWRGVIDRLCADRRCIAPDFMGLGYTRVASGQGVTPADQVRMLLALLDHLGVSRADVVANDSGSAVAQLLAVGHPDRVRSLLLTNGDTEIDCPPKPLLPVIALSHERRFVAEWLAPWLHDADLARSAQGLGGLTYTFRRHPTDEAVDVYLAPLVAHPDGTHAYALGLETNVLEGIGPALQRSRIPTRVVWGMGDTTFSTEGAAYLERMLGNSRGVRRLEGANLFFPEEFPDLITDEARALWEVA
jgi:pimeloyl-ACP methyl ester carboxylesterase